MTECDLVHHVLNPEATSLQPSSSSSFVWAAGHVGLHKHRLLCCLLAEAVTEAGAAALQFSAAVAGMGSSLAVALAVSKTRQTTFRGGKWEIG